MIVTIHQPEFMPYGGFFAKAMRADVFILLDIVQFKKNYFENRNRVLVNGEAKYVTVPVIHKNRLDSTFREVPIANLEKWAHKIRETLRSNYRHHPQFEAVFPFFDELFRREHGHLAELNIEIIRYLGSLLGIEAEWVLASDLGIEGKRSQLLADLTHAVGGASYLSGPSGREYLEFEPFERHGLEVCYHDYHAAPYPQPKLDHFEPNLSVFDLLCCLPPADARENLLAGSTVSDQ